MKFETKLSCETIKQRLFNFADPISTSNYLSENQYLFKWNNCSYFYIMKTGDFHPRQRFDLPFVARIEVHNNSTYIIGKFALAKSTKIALTCFFGFTWIMALFGCFLNSNFNIFGKVIVFVCYIVITIIGFLSFSFFPGLFQKRQQRAVIEFIKQHLLS